MIRHSRVTKLFLSALSMKILRRLIPQQMMCSNASGASGYYGVASVDSFGDESVQSLGISPAAVASAAGSGGGGCFINTVSGSIPAGLFWILVIFTIAVAITVRRKASR